MAQKHVISVNDACVVSIKRGDNETTSDTGTTVTSIELTAGVGTIIDICAIGTTTTQVFKCAAGGGAGVSKGDLRAPQ